MSEQRPAWKFCFLLKSGCSGIYHQCRSDGLPACGVRVDTCALEYSDKLSDEPCRRCFPSGFPSDQERLDMSLVTERYFSDFECPNVINTGWCYIWAWMAQLHFGVDRVQLATWDESHALVLHDGRFYDSSAPRGVKHMRELWFFSWWGKRAYQRKLVRQSPEEFERIWRQDLGYDGLWHEQGLSPFPSVIPTSVIPTVKVDKTHPLSIPKLTVATP